jgi:hypothetical protein
MARHPNRNLLKPHSHPLSKFAKEVPVLRCILHVNENADQVIPEYFASLLPVSFNALCFERNSAKFGAKLNQSVSNEGVRDRRAIVKPER